MLEISSNVRCSNQGIKKEKEWTIIAKLMDRLKTVKFKNCKDNEARFLEEAQRYLDQKEGKRWSKSRVYMSAVVGAIAEQC